MPMLNLTSDDLLTIDNLTLTETNKLLLLLIDHFDLVALRTGSGQVELHPCESVDDDSYSVLSDSEINGHIARQALRS